MAEEHPPIHDEPNLPPALADRLARLYEPHIFVAPAADEQILTQARSRFAALRRRRLIWQRVVPWTAAAAVLLAAVLIYQPTPGPPAAPLAGDVDHNGRVDILDAFTVARRLEAAAAPEPQWDVTGDGTVDHRDVDAIAHLAVSLSEPSGGNSTSEGTTSGGGAI